MFLRLASLLQGIEEENPRPLPILMNLTFREGAAVRLLGWLAVENALIMRERPDLPLLYDAGVVYEREDFETWSDVIQLYALGYEDCDALAAARAGELLARGYRALKPGDGGYIEALRLRPRSIKAEPFLRTKTVPGRPGLYHVVVRYRVGNTWFRDDPSARLGMYDGEMRENPWPDPETAKQTAMASVAGHHPHPHRGAA